MRNISVGATVDEGKDLAKLVDVTPIIIDFQVPATFVRLISPGQDITVKVDGFGDKKFDATIDAVDALIDPSSHSLSARGSIPNSSGELKPGLFGRVNLIAGSKDDALLVPEIAVEISGDENFVFKVVEQTRKDGTKTMVAYRTVVTTGLREGKNIEIVRGLKKGDLVVTSGQIKIRDRSFVRPINYTKEELTKTAEEPQAQSLDKKNSVPDKDTAPVVPRTPKPKDFTQEIVREKKSGMGT